MEHDTATATQLNKDGFAVIKPVFSEEEVTAIIREIEAAVAATPAFRQATSVFAIRRLLIEIPALANHIFTKRFCDVVHSYAGKNYFVSKAIYFDKPPASNWFVPFHQDLTISLEEKHEIAGFGPWTVKPGQFAVQPPVSILEDNITFRIHLDDTDEKNGALHVVPATHTKGIVRPETLAGQEEVICDVQKGGIMIMRPLLLHASGRTTNDQRRRVIHLECSASHLPSPLQWAEKMNID